MKSHLKHAPGRNVDAGCQSTPARSSRIIHLLAALTFAQALLASDVVLTAATMLVTPDQPTENETAAADLLQTYLRRAFAGQAGFEIVRESQAPAALDTAPVERMSFFPLTLPLTTGPGTIAASIALSAERRSSEISYIVLNALAFTLMAATVALTVWVAYANAAAVARRLGPTGMLIAAKLAAFVLLCIGAQIMLTGVVDALTPILAKR